jgi:hypothetical protein
VIVGIVASLVVGGGYAIASGGSNGQLSACVHKHGHGLYTGKCKKHDKRITWSKSGPAGPPGAPGKQGPAGPGATKLVYDATGTASGTATPIGIMGPYALSASCKQPTGGTTSITVFITGPAGRLDGSDNGAPVSGGFAALTNSTLLGTVTSSSSKTTSAVTDDLLWLPASGPSIQTLLTASATGGSTNACHFSAAITPMS